MNVTKLATVTMGLAVGLSLLCSGCLVCAGSSVTYGGKGEMVSDRTLSRIEPGKTTEGELVAMLGEPTKKEAMPEDSQLYKYEYVKKTRRNVAVFVLLATSNNKEERTRLCFRIKDDVVQEFWKDSSSD